MQIHRVLVMDVAMWVFVDVMSGGVGQIVASELYAVIIAIRQGAPARMDSAFAIVVGVVKHVVNVYANISVGVMVFAVMVLVSVLLDGRVTNVKLELAYPHLVQLLGRCRILFLLALRHP